MLSALENAKQIKERLRNPVNGRQSSELEITSSVVFRRKRYEAERVQIRQARAVATKVAIAAAAAEAKRKAMEALLLAGYGPPRPTVARIMNEVCRHYKATELDIRSKRRTADIVMPRHIVMYLCKALTELSLPQIGRRIGGRDHTSVLHAVKKITALVENHPHLSAEIDDIKRSLLAP